MLSRLETGHVSPSLETILALSRALGVTASALMQRVGTDDGGAQLIKSGEGLETVRSGARRGHTYHLLAAQRGPHKIFEPFLVTLNGRGRDGSLIEPPPAQIPAGGVTALGSYRRF